MNYKPLNSIRIFQITGATGFIGYFLSKKLLDAGSMVIWIDNMNDYYNVNLKHTRLEKLKYYKTFTFIKADISNKGVVLKIFETYKLTIVVNLAAEAGVRSQLKIQMCTYKVM